jgi:hypothetical protein
MEGRTRKGKKALFFDREEDLYIDIHKLHLF